jgi:hypothetical protein
MFRFAPAVVAFNGFAVRVDTPAISLILVILARGTDKSRPDAALYALSMSPSVANPLRHMRIYA